jgi:hypothetical protein
MTPPPHGLTGNQNAAKPSNKKLMSILHLHCRGYEKKAWAKTAKANDMSLSAWVRAILNENSHPQ